ncbi:anti-sigma factor [Aeoliella sp.]|uniref:anti-sigma factor n=1 Tax=Aeoliella sp. TaxID=2795800 RepID=UPI003CCC45E4
MEWLETSALRFAAAIAATLLMTGWIGYSSWHGWRQHAEVANDFLHYATQLQRDPAAAREYFVIKYGGQPVDDNVDVERLAYRPTVASGLPPGYTLVASDVLRMPGCECIGSLCKRDDGSALAIFEHETEQPHWFADQPSIQVQCSGQPTQNVELGTDRLAATWPINNRYLTVIGARDIEEVTQLVSNFTTRTGDL